MVRLISSSIGRHGAVTLRPKGILHEHGTDLPRAAVAQAVLDVLLSAAAPLASRQIADQLGLHREAVRRALAELRKNGKVLRSGPHACLVYCCRRRAR